MSEQQHFPLVNEMLLEALKEVFPDQLPPCTRSDLWEQVLIKMGEQNVIRFLQSQYEFQTTGE